MAVTGKSKTQANKAYAFGKQADARIAALKAKESKSPMKSSAAKSGTSRQATAGGGKSY